MPSNQSTWVGVKSFSVVFSRFWSALNRVCLEESSWWSWAVNLAEVLPTNKNPLPQGHKAKCSGQPWCCHVDLSCCSIFNLLCKVKMTTVTGKLSECHLRKTRSFHTINRYKCINLIPFKELEVYFYHIFRFLFESISKNLPLADGFNHFEKNESNWSFPQVGGWT